MQSPFGILKLYDSLYISQSFGSQDLETILMNHITHIINLTSSHTPNYFSSHQPILYLSFSFTQDSPDYQTLLNPTTLLQIFNFIEEAKEQGECVLVNGWKGYELASVVMVGYLMMRYGWGVKKGQQFVERKVGKVEERANKWLDQVEKRLEKKEGDGWQLKAGMERQKQTITNTFINALMLGKGRASDVRESDIKEKKKKKKVNWRDPTKSSTISISKPPSYKLKSILKAYSLLFPVPFSSQLQSTQNPLKPFSASHSVLKDKQPIRDSNSLETKSLKFLFAKISDKLRTTISLFKPTNSSILTQSNLSNQSVMQTKFMVKLEEQNENIQDKKNIGQKNTQKIKKSRSQLIQDVKKIKKQESAKQLNVIQKQIECNKSKQTVLTSASDITRQILKKNILENNNSFLFNQSITNDNPNTNANKQKQNNQGTQQKIIFQFFPNGSIESKPIISQPFLIEPSLLLTSAIVQKLKNNFVNSPSIIATGTKPYSQSRPESPVENNDQRRGKGVSEKKMELKIKGMRGISPLLRQKKKGISKKGETDIFNIRNFEGARKAWK